MLITDLKDLKSLLSDKKSDFEWPKNENIEISLKNQLLTRDDVEKLITVLKDKNCNLTKLELQNCFLDSQDIQKIMDALKERPPTLKILNLSENNVGHEGAKSIAEALKQESMSNVRILTLNHTKMGDGAVEEIAQAIKARNTDSSHSFVTVLNLVGNYLSLDAAERVLNLLGEIHVLFDTPVKNRDLHFYIDIVGNDSTYEEYQDRETKMYEKMGASKGDFGGGSSVVPFYHYQQSSSEMMFSDKYKGGIIRTSHRTRSTSLLTQFRQKIEYLEKNFKNDKEKETLIISLKKLYSVAKHDIDTQVSKSVQLTTWEDSAKQAAKLLESPAMLVLEATDQVLTKFLKEGEKFDLRASLRTYANDCQGASEDWTSWQVLAAGVIIGLVSFFAAIFPPNLPIMLNFVNTLREASGNDPKYGFYLAEQLFHKAAGTKGTFFEPYGKLTSDISGAMRRPIDEKASPAEDQKEGSNNTPPPTTPSP